MSDGGGFSYAIESDLESDLVRSLERLQADGDVSPVRGWLTAYRSRELQSETLIADRNDRFKKVSDAFGGFYQSYRASEAYGAHGASREYLKGMETALSKVIAIDEGMTQDEEALWELFRSHDFEALNSRLRALASFRGEEAMRLYLEGYERRLLDGVFFVAELGRVFLAEYNPRVETARARLTSRTEKLRIDAEQIVSRVAELDAEIEGLTHDESVVSEDRKVFLDLFVRKRSDLIRHQKALTEKTAVVGALLTEYRAVLSRFAAYLAELQSQARRNAVRTTYLHRLKSAGAQRPVLAAIADDAVESLRSNAAMIEETFLLLNDSFQEELLSALDSDRSIDTITVTLKALPEVSYAISTSNEGEPPSLDLAAFSPLAVSPGLNGRGTRSSARSRRSIRPTGKRTGSSPREGGQ